MVIHHGDDAPASASPPASMGQTRLLQRMTRRVVRLPDGRYLVYYVF